MKGDKIKKLTFHIRLIKLLCKNKRIKTDAHVIL